MKSNITQQLLVTGLLLVLLAGCAVVSFALRRVAEGVDQLLGIANASALASRLSARATALASGGAMGSSGQLTK